MPSIGPWQFFPEYFKPEDDDFIYDFPPQWPKIVHCWRARHRNNQKTIVVKAIHKDLAYDPSKEKEENQIFKELNHPNLIKVYDVVYQAPSDWICYLLEYCEGGSLHDHLYHRQRENYLPRERCLEITQEILRGLSYMHNHPEELIHRDLKPGNIFFCKDGTPKIGDYGLIKSTKWEKFVSTAGTPGYKAPERKYDKRSDVYSVGIILQEMIMGQPPPSQQSGQRKRLRAGWLGIIAKATASNPRTRYQSAEEFIQAIKELKS